MKITKLTITDYLGLRSIAIEPGEINLISGGNGKGKTAVLKALREAFISSGMAPDKINLNAQRAEILLTLDNGVDIDRRITPSTNSVTVTSGGLPLSRPVEYLKGLLGPAFTFNPIEFYRAKPPERRKMLLEAIDFRLQPDAVKGLLVQKGFDPETISSYIDKVNWTEHGLIALEQLSKLVYEHRAEVNRDRDKLKKTIAQQTETIPESFDAERYKGFELNSVMADLQEAQEAIGENKILGERVQGLSEEFSNLKREVASIDEQIAKLKARRAEAEERMALVKVQGKKLQEKVAGFVEPDIAGLKIRIAGYEQHREVIQRLKEIERYRGELETVSAEWRALDELHQNLTGEVPRMLMSQLDTPIKGLEFSGDAVSWNGVEIDNLSTSEQIRLAVQIAQTMVGELKVVCVDGVETMDGETLAAFLATIEPDDIQYFITRVTKGELEVTKVGAPISERVVSKGPAPARSQQGISFD